MKKNFILSILVVVGLVSFVLATAYYGTSVLGSSSVADPNNALDNDYDYATLQYATNITCPLGAGWSKYSGAPSNFCIHNFSGQIIAGWEVINFNGTVGNASSIKVTASELNLGCTSCANGVDVKVFKTANAYSSSTNWAYAGTCSYADNANQTTCTLNTTGSVSNLLIARWAGGNHRPDPAVHVAWIEN